MSDEYPGCERSLFWETEAEGRVRGRVTLEFAVLNVGVALAEDRATGLR